MNTLGKWLRKFRIDQDLTLIEFAKKIDIKSPSYISGIERGTTKPSEDFAAKIIDIFQLTKNQTKELKTLIIQQTELIKEHKAMTPQQIAWARKLEDVDLDDKVLNDFLRQYILK